jgi:hypothetical protein
MYGVQYTAGAKFASCSYLRNGACYSYVSQRVRQILHLRNKGHFCNTKFKVFYVVMSLRWENSWCHISSVFTDSSTSRFIFRTDLKPPIITVDVFQTLVPFLDTVHHTYLKARVLVRCTKLQTVCFRKACLIKTRCFKLHGKHYIIYARKKSTAFL